MIDFSYPLIRCQDDLDRCRREFDAATSDHKRLVVLTEWSYNDPALFNDSILGRPSYWSRQRDVCKSYMLNTTTLVISGNSVGKSFLLSGLVAHHAFTRPDSITITTGPTANQLKGVLWRYIADACNKSPYKLTALRIKTAPYNELKLDNNWLALGISTTKTEKLSGYHAGHLAVFVDEASGVKPEIYGAIDSLVYNKMLLMGNPIRNDGKFYELHNMAMRPNSGMGLVKISSLESPDINLRTSPRGLASATWIKEVKMKYGEGSLYWKSHVLAEWPDESDEALIPHKWLDELGCGTYPQNPMNGHVRIAVDLAEGKGNDYTVIIVRDDNGILYMLRDNKISLENTANKIGDLAAKYGVAPWRIVFDATGTGNDFANRLESVGIVGATPFKGKERSAKGAVGENLRTNAAYALRWRLDPARVIEPAILPPPPAELPCRIANPIAHLHARRYREQQQRLMTHQQIIAPIKQPKFNIPQSYLELIRPELQSLRVTENTRNRMDLESKVRVKERLGRSPDCADALIMSFAYSG